MNISTKALDVVRPYVEKAAYNVDSYGGGEVYGDFAGTIQSAIRNYLDDMQAADLRQQREMNPWANAAIMNRRDQVADADFRIVARDGQEFSDDEQDLVNEIMEMLERPDPAQDGESIGQVEAPAVDDALVINRGCLQRLEFDDGSTRGLKCLDGNRVKNNPKWKPNADGSLPKDIPRYFYKNPDAPSEAPPVPFNDDQIIIYAPYALSYDAQGLAPMRALKRILQAELDVFTWMHRTQQQGSPGGIFMLPGAAPGTPDRAKQIYELKLAGKAGLAFMNLPKDSKYVELGSMNAVQAGTFTFYEILMKATAISFRTTPFHLGWEPKAALSTSTDAQMEFADDGILSLLRFLRGIKNRRIIASYGDRAANLYFTYTMLEAEEELLDGPELRAIAGPIGFASMNDVKVMRGMQPYTEDSLKEILGGNEEMMKGVWPLVSQEWVPVLSGTTVIQKPLQYAYEDMQVAKQQQEQSMQQQQLATQQQQAQHALTSAIVGQAGKPEQNGKADGAPAQNGKEPTDDEQTAALTSGQKSLFQMSRDAQHLLMLRKAIALGENDSEFDALIQDLSKIDSIFEEKQKRLRLPADQATDEDPVSFDDE